MSIIAKAKIQIKSVSDPAIPMHLRKDFNHSYWEIKHYFKKFDLIIIGSGIVGLSTAISFKQKNKKASVLILEKGIMPDGASSKNAGFACFGSPGEILHDLDHIPPELVWETVSMRWEGLRLLRKRLSDKQLGYKQYGNYELFQNKEHFSTCAERLSFLNKNIHSYLRLRSCYTEVPHKKLPFKKLNGAIINKYEGQLDTAKMMSSLLLLARTLQIEILNNIHVNSLDESEHLVNIHSKTGIFSASKVVVATNGFATQLLDLKDLSPARAQVLVTGPLRNLKIKGAFHFEQGFYYFRNIDDRILFGGGRNLAIQEETTTKHGLNGMIQEKLISYLKDIILPDQQFTIEHQWSGIMGVGAEKKPIIQKAGKNILAAVRMGGMGIAIGSLVGEIAAKKIS